MVVIAILLMSTVAGVWLVKKYICGGRSVHHISHKPITLYIFFLCFSVICSYVFIRFLVHRYSVMRENVEANKIEGVDDIDAHYMETGKAHFNEDSDQVSNTLFNVHFYQWEFVIINQLLVSRCRTS